MPVLYDPAHPDWTAVRRVFFDWLRSSLTAVVARTPTCKESRI